MGAVSDASPVLSPSGVPRPAVPCAEVLLKRNHHCHSSTLLRFVKAANFAQMGDLDLKPLLKIPDVFWAEGRPTFLQDLEIS